MLAGINILVAEDNLLNQKIVQFILQKQHADVSRALNGEEVIELMEKNSYDIILMDLQMPRMDGFAATKHIREVMKSKIPIIGITASISDEELTESIAGGMNACMSKPYDADSLCLAIFQLVKESKMQQTH